MFLSKKVPFILLILLLTAVISATFIINQKNGGDVAKQGGTTQNILDAATNGAEGTSTASENISIEEILTELTIPWEIAFLPNNAMLVTQRDGTLLYVSEDTKTNILVTGVHHEGEGGLLGLALDPNYSENNYLYLYATSKKNGSTQNAVHRYTFNESTATLTNKLEILGAIPGATYHDGGRIAFGPDGYLYITTGDAQNPSSAQDTKTLSGKILRIGADGSIPSDNPFGNAVYSYGHRNPQGIDWDSQGRLWSNEHGRSIPLSGYDEVNLITSGGNYGWPTIQGSEQKSDMISPVLQSGASNTWAPGDLVIHEDFVIFTGLKSESLYTARISGDKLIDFTQLLTGEYGRIRSVVIDPTQTWLYFTTSNKDGRGEPSTKDDKIVRIKLDSLLPQ